MRRFLLIILVTLLVSAICIPVALSAPEGFKMLMLDSQGTDVVRMQMRLRDLGYISYRATGMYYGMTQAAVQDFQKNNELDPDGRCGELTYDKMFETNLVRRPKSPDVRITSGPPLIGNPTEYGKLADWFEEVDGAFPVGATATVVDFNSGTTFKMKRTGGTNHAEVEPINGDEYKKYIKSFGEEPNWEKRSVLVKVGGKTYAASLFGNQMGDDNVPDNVMAGHTCLYFWGSKSHALGFMDKEHQIMILTAAGEDTQYVR